MYYTYPKEYLLYVRAGDRIRRHIQDGWTCHKWVSYESAKLTVMLMKYMCLRRHGLPWSGLRVSIEYMSLATKCCNVDVSFFLERYLGGKDKETAIKDLQIWFPEFCQTLKRSYTLDNIPEGCILNIRYKRNRVWTKA